MYDGLTARYSFPCPAGGDAHVRLSSFRAVERLPGTGAPAVYAVRFACPCGGEHSALATHGDLDWAPLGAAAALAFFNVMTGRFESAAASLADEAAHRIRHGSWPWTFFCVAEEQVQPVYPSAFRLIAEDGRRRLVAVSCPSCACTSVNVVTADHLDVPFYSDREVGVVEHVYGRESDLGAVADGVAARPGELGLRSLTSGSLW